MPLSPNLSFPLLPWIRQLKYDNPDLWSRSQQVSQYIIIFLYSKPGWVKEICIHIYILYHVMLATIPFTFLFCIVCIHMLLFILHCILQYAHDIRTYIARDKHMCFWYLLYDTISNFFKVTFKQHQFEVKKKGSRPATSNGSLLSRINMYLLYTIYKVYYCGLSYQVVHSYYITLYWIIRCLYDITWIILCTHVHTVFLE